MTPSFIAPQPAGATSPESDRVPRGDATLRAFTQTKARPTTTFPLVLVAVTVSVLSMSLDAVARYSHDAFFAGILLTVMLAIVAGKVVDALEGSPYRIVPTVLLPTTFGAAIGMVVQVLVLKDVGTSMTNAVKDLGGLVDTTAPIPWVASGIVLGGVPALLVSVFLVLASRSLRRLVGHDASEGFSVAFTGFAGLLATFGLGLVDGIATPPLLFVAIARGYRTPRRDPRRRGPDRFLRKIYAGQTTGFDIVPAQRFADDPSLAPIVANAGSASVLVRFEGDIGSYRAAAAEPIASVASTEQEALRPLLRRRVAGAALLVAMAALVALSALTHA